MDRLTMADMNSLNAIAGYLRCAGKPGMAEVLLSIQRRATAMIVKEDSNGIPENSKRNQS